MVKFPQSLSFRRIFTTGLRFAKCPSGPGSKSVCLYDDPLPEKVCRPAAANPEWEAEEAVLPLGPRVVVLGAGPSGLTAADRLLRAGLKEITVLEATCRAGGRLRSQWVGDTVVELGLSLSGKRSMSWDHPLLQLGTLDPPVGFDPTAGILDPPTTLPPTFQAYTELMEIQQNEDSKIPGYTGLRAEQAGRSQSASEREEVARNMAAISALIGPKPKVVEDGFGAYSVSPGGTRIPLGESRLLLPLLERVGSDRLLYRKEAVSVRWGTVTPDQKPRAVVRCTDGSEYPAEFVILTCSIGCLKRNLESMFCPPLPPSKAAAIQNASFLQENKAFLVFEDPIWSWSDKPIDFDFNDPLRPGHPKPVPNKKDWTKGILVMKKEEGSEKVVRVKVVGEDAVMMERATDDAVIELLHSLLQEKLASCDIPLPKKIVRSKWCDTRHTLGLHSAAGSHPELSSPVPTPDFLPPVLLFAGEGTAPVTGLRGAVLSGLREAERLLSILAGIPHKLPASTCPKFCK